MPQPVLSSDELADLYENRKGLIVYYAMRFSKWLRIDFEDLRQEVVKQLCHYPAKPIILCARHAAWSLTSDRDRAGPVKSIDMEDAPEHDSLAGTDPDPADVAEGRDLVKHALELATPAERALLVEVFGLDGRESASFEDIARRRGTTSEKVRQAVRKAIDNIRSRMEPAAV